MTKNNKYFLFFILLLLFLLLNSKTFPNENKNFFSLKNSETNLRLGPSFEYPIKLIYKKKYLPVIVLDQYETWKKIKDFKNNSGWIHISQLSKKKTAINIKNNSILYNKNTIYSKPVARLEVGRLVIINKCKVNWCKVRTGNYKGWTLKKNLWGKIK